MPATRSQPPVGTRHKAKRAFFLAKLAALEKELERLPNLIKTHFKKWSDGAREFQLSCMRAQVLKKDVLLHAATGAGKTGIAAGPHLLPSNKGKVTLVVSPLLALEEEQVETFREEFGLKATAINSANGGCSPSIMAEVVAGEWQIVILSPEMLLSRKFIDGVLRKPEFGPQCLSIFIDEAHCISHWGASFRKAYSSIGIVRAFLPTNTPIVAVTATLTSIVHQDLLSKLQFDRNNYLFLNVGNDRPNVAQVVRAMEHPMNTFRDLDFLVPAGISSPVDIKKGFLYSDDIKAGSLIVDYLNQRVDPKYCYLGLVRPYNATMSKKYRKKVMKLFQEGKIRILVCTDAAGMGCDIPDIDIVVQWKVPKNISSWVQRAGRAARAPGRQGLAVMIVEKSAFEIAAIPQPLTDSTRGVALSRVRGRGRGRGGVQGRAVPAKNGPRYAVAHGQRRGMFGGEHDEMTVLNETHITLAMLQDAAGEGIYFYIQTTNCRRSVLRMIFRNEPSGVDKASCCDLCNSRLFDQVCPSKLQATTRQKALKRVAPVDSVRMALYGWRREMKRKYWPRSLWGPQSILDNGTCELLASIGPVESESFLSSVLKASWEWWDKLSTELFSFLQALDIPPFPQSSRGTKRHPPTSLQDLHRDQVPGPLASAIQTSPSKRARTTVDSEPATSGSTQTAPAAPRRRRTKEVAPLEFMPTGYDDFFSQFNSKAK
ncbi:P-loop containing nucleoside triphosphate hydrolase protein [Flammula alnicola]|nr:P-loop containing nucleoside triphosphate hydrolase protein [Flammula alnicola]